MDPITALETWLATRTATANQPAPATLEERRADAKLDSQARVNTLGFPRAV